MSARYDSATAVRYFDAACWLEPEDLSFLRFARSGDEWRLAIAAPQLAPHVPVEITAHFETSRGTIAYAWFFYPLATVGFENLTRTMELAVRLRAEASGGAARTYEQNLKRLIQRGIVPLSEEAAWQAGRQMRNSSSHPGGKFLIDPGGALSFAHLTADRINLLYPTPV